MTERPVAELHADAIDVHLTSDGTFAALAIVNEAQAFTVSLPRVALEEFIRRAAEKLKTTALESASVEFKNGGQPGVRLKKQESAAGLTRQIDHMRERMSREDLLGLRAPRGACSS